MKTFLDFFEQGILFPITELIKLLQDKAIARQFFGNSNITLWTVLFVFFIGALVIKFILRPFPLAYKSHPLDIAPKPSAPPSRDQFIDSYGEHYHR